MECSSKKRDGPELDGGDDEDNPMVTKRPTTPPVEENDDLATHLAAMEDSNNNSIDLDDLMKFVDDANFTTKIKFIENPYASIFHSSSSYITINGNEEICGSSFSDYESSFMASIDMGGSVNGRKSDSIDGSELCEWFQGGGGGAWSLSEGNGMARVEEWGSFGGEWDFLEYECFVDGHGGVY